MLNSFLNSYIPVVFVAIMVLILMCVVLALYKTYRYFVDRFPVTRDAYDRFVDFDTKAREAEARLNTLNEQYEHLLKSFDESMKRAMENGIELAQLKETQAKLATEQANLEDARNQLDNLREKYRSSKYEIDSMMARKESLEKEIEDLNHVLDTIKEQNPTLADLKKEYEQLQAKIKDLNRERESLEQSIREKNTEIKNLEFELNDLKSRTNEAREDYENAKLDLKGVKDELNVHQAELERIKSEIDSNKDMLIKKAELQLQLQMLEEKIASNNEVKDQLEDGIEKLKGECKELKTKYDEITQKIGSVPGDQDKAVSYRELYNLPDCLNVENTAAVPMKTGDEVELLREFKDALADNGYDFSDSIIKAFHTSLKIQDISPLTVLAGISGTGKTLLPTKYAEFFGIFQLIIPVQPRWDSPQDLLGFYNYLEQKYQATDLAKALVYFDGKHVQKDKSAFLKDRLLLVLLDEMNLARTEYYFSEFLSRLELRRTVDLTDESSRQKAQISIDNNFGSLWVPNNVFFVGTMNEDESTQTLSDKVLDRASMIRFGRPEIHKTIKKHESSHLNGDRYLTKRIWDKWCDHSSDSLKDNSKLLEEIEKLNYGMYQAGRPFGHRVADSIIAYVENYPDESDNIENKINLGLCDQIQLKILPKLRGCDLNDPRVEHCMDEIRKVIERRHNSVLLDAFDAASDKQKDLFSWTGINQ